MSYAYDRFVELCDKTGKCPGAVCRESGGKIRTCEMTFWKQGKYELGLKKLLVISKIFGVSIEYFIDTSEENNIAN